jgi:hypothetical protein
VEGVLFMGKTEVCYLLAAMIPVVIFVGGGLGLLVETIIKDIREQIRIKNLRIKSAKHMRRGL